MANRDSVNAPFWLVIPAAGIGQRLQGEVPKQYQQLVGKTVLEHTLDVFLPINALKGIVVVLNAGDEYFSELVCAQSPLVATTVGGDQRADSVLNGLDYLDDKAQDDDWVLVHDAARPCVQTEDVIAMVSALSFTDAGGVMAVPVSDTVKSVEEGRINATEDRRHLWQAQTPQMFRFSFLRSALREAKHKNLTITDEASAVEYCGVSPQVYPGKRSNIKITHPEDLLIAESLLRSADMNNQPRVCVGHGYDVHRFAGPEDNAFVVLGGVKIVHDKKLLAHSDGDVLIHALCDALLGAAGLGDIGRHFPDTDESYQNIDSRTLLKKVADMIVVEGLSVGNVDITLIAEAPKVSPHAAIICSNLAEDLGIAVNRINIKATTTEKLGPIGRGEGIACHASVLLTG